MPFSQLFPWEGTMILKYGLLFLQLLLAITFLVIPISRIFGAFTLQQVLSLGVPPRLVWVANVIELGGAVLLLLGLRMEPLAAVGALLIVASMMGATLIHVHAGNLFAELPWTLVFLGLSLVVVLLRWSAVQAVLRNL